MFGQIGHSLLPTQKFTNSTIETLLPTLNID
uniref:Uncharacterized protein n=1 Tax=Anguilla anguilla TaxID=7936 RepID=A0A0E9T9Z3_ANGAN